MIPKTILRAGFALALSVGAVSISFATTSVLSIPTNLTGDHGTTAQVPISVAPGTGILGIDMTVHYDPAVLQIQSVAVSGIAQAAGFGLAANTSTAGVIVLTTYATSNALSGSGEVLRIRFTVAGVSGNTSALTMTNVSINEGQIPSSVQNGLFTVTPLPMVLSLPAATGDPGSNVDVPLSAANAGGAVNIAATFQFNASVVQAQSVTVSGIAAAAGFSVSSNLSTPGVVSLTLSGGTALSGSGELAKIRFHVAGPQSATTSLSFTSWSVNSGAIAATVQNGSFTINPVTVLLSLPSDAVGSTGSTVQIPVSATPGDSICRVDTTIQYDASVIQAENVTVSGIAAAAGFAVTANVATPGVVTISTFETTGCLVGSGEFLRIQFHVLGALGATSPLTFTSATVNNGQLPAAFHQGEFSVVAFCATAPDGTACNDLNACTQSDTCQGGVCVGANPVICPPQDSCHVGVCNSSDGTCSQQAKPDNSACDDGNVCTQTDACQSGACVGSSPVTCIASDQCHVAGTCDVGTGVCSNPAAANGTSCNDGNACTQTDACQSGACVGSNPVLCTASDQCHVAGTCNSASGICSNPTAANGTACDDGNACTTGDTCGGGVCNPGTPVVCNDNNVCTTDSCNPATGCVYTNNTNACDDGNACTQTDTCQSGACVGANPVMCFASDQCHTAGTCNSITGLCTNPIVADGTTCNDGNACTVGDACNGGACAGTTISVPPETLNVSSAADKATFTWSAEAEATQYGVVRGSVGAFPVGPGGGDETCFANLTEPTLVDPTIPLEGSGFWYLSRGENACGIGTFGAQSDGTSRVTSSCP